MEEIKYRLTEQNYHFLKKFQESIGSELIFFGSIKRCDFLQKYSDIDIAIISDNVENTLAKLKNFLNMDNQKIRKIFQKFKYPDSNIVNGYKITYKDIDNDIIFDIMVYDEKYRIPVMNNINKINNLPTYMIFLMCILKYLYYTLGLLTKGMFLDVKNFIFTWYFTNKFNFEKKNNTSSIFLNE